MVKEKQIFLIIILYLIFASFYFINVAPNSNITKKNILQEWAPQGFAFYSKNPRDETLIFETDQKLLIPNMQIKNILGLKRTGRVQAIELAKIQGNIPNDNWGLCKNENECESIKESLKIYKVNKDENYRSLEKGIYYIYSYEPLSWYFKEFQDTSTIQKRIAKVVLE